MYEDLYPTTHGVIKDFEIYFKLIQVNGKK